ncbi:hypothetical protein TREMEDRAFT_26165 [Tremella mesenterica DSM 1558]|uniref:uncharacterized protein n=1 Tax=Tremella mesenterica (strain ATCC 24925 / CBS 8224 / DSM 1558 / NBRC 9311 / NRRL Y-6157 / RJB 2259-6 / UBC 559-6) TaxID=578456 RepID=UPI0003F49D75|nr:uncharacterized protein TREMEDRAFT_26165 [Tremella mesenterica DSM 1558]EIW72030.1 hypothetical protein TREMEDRAFT_26165 [Tremella mesenterica DSM 1558]
MSASSHKPIDFSEPHPNRPVSTYEELDFSSDLPPVDPWSSPSSAGGSSRFSQFSSFSPPRPTPSATFQAQSETKQTSTSNSSQKSTTGPALDVPLVLGVAVVDFNHLIGPTVEFAYPQSLQIAIQDDDSFSKLLPFLALPDGAHLVYPDALPLTNVPPGQTLFGISCNRQLAAAELLKRPSDVTRSMVQKAVVVIASQPVFGPIRDRLGVVTRAYFAQRDFTQTGILEDFYTSLETSLQGKSGEGTSLRELIHKFRHKTLILLKALMLQKRVMLFGYPVEMLCTYQYSLVSLMPGLLLNLRDSGAPELDYRTSRVRPTSLRSSDRSSLLRYMGLPLHLFGKDAFFQPYLPLQQIEMLKARSWLVGTTNQIVTQQKDARYDLLVNIENVSFEFTDPKLERLLSLTAADRKWMDDVVRAVEETWATLIIRFRGSDDDLRSRFEEYICACLSSIKYADFLAKGKQQDIAIVTSGSGAGGDGNVLAPFGEAWLMAFKITEAGKNWEQCTDPVLFDLCEPR